MSRLTGRSFRSPPKKGDGGACVWLKNEVIVRDLRNQGVKSGVLCGRAICRQRTGDGVSARKDFEQYRQLFPKGAHSREVEKQIGGP